MYSGKCVELHVGVNAPGIPTITLLSAKATSELTVFLTHSPSSFYTIVKYATGSSCPSVIVYEAVVAIINLYLDIFYYYCLIYIDKIYTNKLTWIFHKI